MRLAKIPLILLVFSGNAIASSSVNRSFCLDHLREAESRPTTSIQFFDLMGQPSHLFVDIVRTVGEMLPEMKMPEQVSLEVTPFGHEKKGAIRLWKRLITVRENLRLPPEISILPIFAHEYGHAVVTETFMRDLPEVRAAYREQFELDRISDAYAEISEELARSNADPVRDLKKRASLRGRLRRLDQEALRKPLSSRARTIFEFSMFFQEPFSDLIAAAVYRRGNAISEGTGNSLRDLTTIDPKCWISGQIHTALIPFASHVYLNYLVREVHAPGVVITQFYELIRDELDAAIASGQIFRKNGHAIHVGQSAMFYGFDNRTYNLDLIRKFDERMARLR